MIDSIKIKNFRSLIESEINFSNSGLNVVIGANGTGKSNVVKALEFIAKLNQKNLSSAIASQNGHLSIIPKAISADNIEGVKSSFEYTISLPLPFNYPSNHPKPKGSHRLEIGWERDPEFRVIDESITYSEPLAVSKALQTEQDEGIEGEVRESTIRFSRRKNGAYVQAWPSFGKKTREDYLHWFGIPIPALEEEIASVKDLNIILKNITERFQKQGEELTDSKSLINWNKNLINFSAQSSVFKNRSKEIKRFDLQLSELRKEQYVERESSLLKHGSNLPRAVEWIQSDKKASPSWTNLLYTMKEIAPHVNEIQTERLKTGREYIQFLESQYGRPVESWDSSDGTLRALAVLIAIESQSEGGTVIIEEPEIGLHPWAIRYLMDHIRDAIERKNIQVLLTTHSEHILESVNPEEVIVATREKERGTKLTPLNELRVAKSIRRGDVGRMWIKGALGGTPS